jgi:hypothetical protein
MKPPIFRNVHKNQFAGLKTAHIKQPTPPPTQEELERLVKMLRLQEIRGLFGLNPDGSPKVNPFWEYQQELTACPSS